MNSIPRHYQVIYQKRTRNEYKIVRSIQHLLHHRFDIVIRRTDKSKVFYIGKLDDFERKTQAYEEIKNGRCPLADNLLAVQTLLGDLVKKNVLTRAQRNRISPKLNNLELNHYHGLPKPHKVNFFIYTIIDVDLRFL